MSSNHAATGGSAAHQSGPTLEKRLLRAAAQQHDAKIRRRRPVQGLAITVSAYTPERGASRTGSRRSHEHPALSRGAAPRTLPIHARDPAGRVVERYRVDPVVVAGVTAGRRERRARPSRPQPPTARTLPRQPSSGRRTRHMPPARSPCLHAVEPRRAGTPARAQETPTVSVRSIDQRRDFRRRRNGRCDRRPPAPRQPRAYRRLSVASSTS
jgi:hypothetical protein